MVQPLVSVIIPTYNMGNYLDKAIRSVQTQTYKNLEIIISDNHSEDNTCQVLQDFLTDNRIKVTSPPKHLPMYGNFNWACREIKGEIVKFLCADDMLLPEAIHKMVDCFNRYPNVGIIQCQGYTINKDGNIVGEYSYGAARPLRTGLWRGCHILDELYPAPDCVTPTHLAIRTQLLKGDNNLDPFDSELISADWDLFLRLACSCDIFRMEDRLVLYRLGGFHEGFDTSYFLEDALRIAERYYLPRSDKDRRAARALYYIRYYWAQIYLWWALKKIFQGHFQFARKVFKTLFDHEILRTSILYSVIHAPSFLTKRWKRKRQLHNSRHTTYG